MWRTLRMEAYAKDLHLLKSVNEKQAKNSC